MVIIIFTRSTIETEQELETLDWKQNHNLSISSSSGPVFCLLLGVSSDYAQPITGKVSEVTCPVIGWAKPELTRSKRQKTGPDQIWGYIDTSMFTHCSLMMPHVDTDLSQHWLGNVDLSSVSFCGTHLGPISQGLLRISIHKIGV